MLFSLDRYTQAARGFLSIPSAPRAWRAFTAAAGAALAMGQTADAQIVYSGPVNQSVFRGFTSLGSNFQNVDLDGNAVNDLNFGVRWSSFLAGGGLTFLNLNSAFVAAAAGNAALRTAGGNVANLASGVQIGPAISFDPSGPGGALRAVETFWTGGGPPTFTTVGEFGAGLVGFRFQQGSDTHFGWLRFDVLSDAAGITLVDYAWESSANVGITAGAVPEPSTLAMGGLALLAMGAVGVRRLREKRAAAAAASSQTPSISA